MGNLFIADAGNNSIRKVTPDGTITTVAQSGFPQGVAVDTAGNVFVADYSNFRIRKVDLNGVITTVAGNGPGFVGDGGLATAARLNYPTGVAVDGTGNLLIGDTYHGRIRRVGVDGKIDTIAGNGEHSLAYPTGVAVDSSGNLFIIDTCSDSVLKVSPGGVISTLGSAGQWYFCDFEGFLPVSPALDQEGTLFVPSVKDHKIQKITSSGIISTVVAGFGPFITPPLYPTGVAVDHAGNLFFADQDNHRVRKVTPTGNISIVAGAGLGGGFFGDGGPATSAFLRLPTAVAVDRAGNLFIADSGNARIRKVAPDGIISTVAGNGRFDFSGDGGVATAASFGHVNGIALDAEGNLFISDSDNNRIRKITFFPRPAPVLTLISPDLTSPGAATEVTLNGTDFAIPFTINTSSDITVDHIRVINDKTATATLAIASNATLGPHPITVTTAFGTSSAATLTVVPPFPDLKVTVSPNGRLAVGFNGVYTVDVRNVGTLPFPGPMTLTDTLPAGLSYVSGTGSGWSCSAAEQAVTCGNSEPLDAGASSRLTLTVAVGAAAANGVTHTVSVEAAGDLVASNNIASDVTVVTNPSPRLVLPPTSPGAGQQATMGIALPESLPYDVTGTVTLRFVSEATNPIDDPAIQFASGGRQVTFVIPANTLEARFATNTQSGPLLFQTGTVAGTFAFEGMLETGTINIPFSSTLKIPRQAPEIRGMQTSMTGGFVASVTLWSTAREVTDLVLQFDTTTNVRLSCGSIANRLCTASGSSLTLNVKEHFDNWYNSDTVFGSLATLRFPLSIQGTVQGTVRVTLRNSMGSSSSVSFQLP
jgi:uncharacterized repeat protein (TIGR01451 family)